MMDPADSDFSLLTRYVRSGDDTAFSELVRRHLGPVLASARRQVGPDLAEDVAQAVFLVLAKKSKSLRPSTVLAAWLFRTTRFVAARARRSELRRVQREQTGAHMLSSEPLPPSDATPRPCTVVESHLDDALASLGETDRRFILSRFFEHLDYAAVGARFGVSSEAARKRVNRAVERLRGFLVGRGAIVSATALAGLLSESITEAAPSVLCQGIGKGATAGSATHGGHPAQLAAGALRDWVWTTIRGWVAGAVVVGIFVGMGLRLIEAIRAPDPVPDPSVATAGQTSTLSSLAGAAVRSDEDADTIATRRFRLELRDAESDRPLADVGVILQVWDDRRVIRTESSRSGLEGVCVLPIREAAPMMLRFWVSAGGHVPIVMDWHRHELDREEVAYVCRLEPGQTLRGEVQDSNGQPVSGAVIQIQEPGLDTARRENIGFHPDLTRVSSDADGRFRSDQMPRSWSTSPITIVARHPDFSRATLSVTDPGAWATNLAIVMKPGVAFVGRVTDAEGTPVAAARLRSNVDGGWSEETVLTDTSGHFEFPHVPPGSFPFVVLAAGYQRHEGYAEVVEGNPPASIRLVAGETPVASAANPPRWVRLIGEVHSADDGRPVPNFSVILRDRGTSQFLGQGRDGAFDWRVDVRYLFEVLVEIEAEGYLPMASEAQALEGEEYRFALRLKRGSDVEAVVLTPDGSPASGARVALAGRTFGLGMREPGVLDPQGAEVRFTLTDTRGRFRLRRKVGTSRVQIVHESGSRFLDLAALTSAMVRLEPWSTVEGRAEIGGRPWARMPVFLCSATGSTQARSQPADFGYEVQADERGYFRFTHVPVGTHLLWTMALRGPRVTNLVAVAAGSAAEADLRRESSE